VTGRSSPNGGQSSSRRRRRCAGLVDRGRWAAAHWSGSERPLYALYDAGHLRAPSRRGAGSARAAMARFQPSMASSGFVVSARDIPWTRPTGSTTCFARPGVQFFTSPQASVAWSALSPRLEPHQGYENPASTRASCRLHEPPLVESRRLV